MIKMKVQILQNQYFIRYILIGISAASLLMALHGLIGHAGVEKNGIPGSG